MAEKAQLTLFDLANKSKICWSYNPWKTRLQLNYKDIPYKTEWIEYPDLAPKLKALGISPNTDENAEYTSPTVIFHGDNAGMMDSSKIAVEIEKRFPQKPVLVNTPMQTKVQQAFSKMFPALMPDIVPRVPRDLLNPPSEEYFRRTREARWGMTFTEKENQGGEKAWKEAEPALNELARLLQSNGGPFFEGSQVSFSDFIFVSALRFIELLNQPLHQRILSIDPVFVKIYEQAKPWLERDSY